MKLIVTKEQSRALTSFRRAPHAPTVRDILEQNINLFRDNYELTVPASEELRMELNVAKTLLQLLFESEQVLGDPNE